MTNSLWHCEFNYLQYTYTVNPDAKYENGF